MKTKIGRLPALNLAVMALLVTSNTPAQLTLGIVRSGNHAVLSWPATVSNCVLQSATNLAAPNWLAMSNVVPVIANGNYTVPITNTARAMFFRLFTTNSTVVPSGMVLIPAGSFMIGDTLDGESDAIPANVYVSAFYLEPNVVSYGLWQTVYNWATNHGYVFDNPGSGKAGATNQPVQTVSWFDCVKWCNARSEKEGLAPAYYTDGTRTNVFRSGYYWLVVLDNSCVKWSVGYRLPTEAEWEKATRGGQNGRRFPWGNTISESQANYMGCSYCYTNFDLGPDSYNAIGLIGGSPYTTPVGWFPPNGYGLYDMAGNVFEWCWDWYQSPPYHTGCAYAGGTDPRGPLTAGNFRILRGGSWFDGANAATCAWRNFTVPSISNYRYGFRCAMSR